MRGETAIRKWIGTKLPPSCDMNLDRNIDGRIE
jgi:hypothetical protein